MLRVGIAPCSPFSVTDRLMRESADQARRLGVRLHTHIAETLDEEAHCVERYGLRPLELLEDRGWLGPDVWLAHCVQLNDAGHRPGRRDGDRRGVVPDVEPSGGGRIAPARALLDAGATVGLGVDGSASNDVGNMALEARMAMLVPRAVGGTGAMSARDALRVATRGGAGCLGRARAGEPGGGQAGRHGAVPGGRPVLRRRRGRPGGRGAPVPAGRGSGTCSSRAGRSSGTGAW